MTQPVVPPIPAALAHRPTVGGVVIPWVNVHLRDGGVDFRSIHRSKWARAWKEGICQTCGKLLDAPPFVMLGGPNQLAKGGYFTEPPLHPACAHYARQACPMVAGRMPAYAATPPVSHGTRGDRCEVPGCDCGGWIPDGGATHYGEPAHAWWAVWAYRWALAVDPNGKLLGGVPTEVRRRKLVSRPPTPAGVE